jgi:hypothetical protein
MAEVRQRKQPAVPASKPSLAEQAKAEDNALTLLDVARTIVFVLLAGSAVSYFVTRESFVWGLQRPSWTRPEVIQSWLVRVLLWCPSFPCQPTMQW